MTVKTKRVMPPGPLLPGPFSHCSLEGHPYHTSKCSTRYIALWSIIIFASLQGKHCSQRHVACPYSRSRKDKENTDSQETITFCLVVVLTRNRLAAIGCPALALRLLLLLSFFLLSALSSSAPRCAQPAAACPHQFASIRRPTAEMDYYSPIKSESDDRHYRGIVLPNKLQVRPPHTTARATGHAHTLCRVSVFVVTLTCVRNMSVALVLAWSSFNNNKH
jgi:hypothetical protein